MVVAFCMREAQIGPVVSCLQFLLFKHGKPGGQQKDKQGPSMQACMQKGLKKRKMTAVNDGKLGD